MITNETRAKLIGWKLPTTGKLRTCDKCGWKSPESERPLLAPSYDTDANAVAELIGYLWHHQGHNAVGRFLHELTKDIGCQRDDAFAMLRATPAQLTKAFDAVFKDDLERIQ